MTEKTERKTSITDYLAAATLAYGTIYFWLKFLTSIELPWIATYIVFYITGLGSTYLICMRIDRNQFPVAIKSAVFSWLFTMICLITFTQGDPSSFFKILLVLFLLGGATASVITMRHRLRPRKKPEPEL